ncbi:triple gene block protein 1 [Cucumber vein-clearing virus]|uniref:Triple gene block protein 1 n=1 Tax=Cucumber vein-clearing virus TaxID=1092564 RepID=G5D8V6_9VIRU|nr:triple gene block protein 1 [Cucumber vein-clearing virus]AEP83727.1 triple gene block protein 1 [Cucumber vein-clearing virus]WOL52749.1 triple gene block protein 1 [Cucumber vein-clearing virus]
MELVLDKLLDLGYIRSSLPLREHLVVNCVPGAGKTTFIRKLLTEEGNFAAFTTGKPDPANVHGNWIRKWEGKLDSSKINILDEYQNLTSIPEGFHILFGDPVQSCNPLVLPPHLTCTETKRFGKQTCELLNSLGFQISSSLEDIVEIEDIYTGEPEGQVICCEREVANLLTAHNLDFLQIQDIIGATFEVVTFITSNSFPSSEKADHFRCLTRHSKRLKILCLNAEYLN